MHFIKYSLLNIIRDKTTMFWALFFPLILATLFEVSFGHMNDNLDCIKTAVVMENESQNAVAFYSFLDEVQSEEKDLIKVEKMSKKNAQKKLKDGKISGVYYLGDETVLKVTGASIEESILQALMEGYDSQKNFLETVIKEKPEKAEEAVAQVASEVLHQDVVKEVSLSGKKVDGMIQYFFSAVAMACMFGCFLGMDVATRLQANIKAVAARRCISSTSKMKSALIDIIMVIVVDYMAVLLLIGYLVFGLKKDFGNQIGDILIIAFAGCLIGASLGLVIGSIGAWSEDIKVVIMLVVSLGGSFLSGLMMAGIKGLIEQYCPILNRINPASLITDAFYSVAVYDDPARYQRDVVTMFAMAGVFIVGAILLTRRVRYDSI